MAQPQVSAYTDIGLNNVSDGLFLKSALFGACRFGKNRVETGFQIDIINKNHFMFSGYTINASRDLDIKGLPFELQAFCTWTSYSEILRENSWGALFKMRHKRFEMSIGTNFRTYAFRKQAIIDYKIEKSAIRIHENFNVMYSFGYYIKKTDDQWNIGLSLTNKDIFIINQETNPILCLHGLYKPGSHMCLNAEFRYKTAGTTNLAMNHFGFFFRTGILWNFN